MLQSVILGPKGKLISKCLFGVFENLPQNEKCIETLFTAAGWEPEEGLRTQPFDPHRDYWNRTILDPNREK